MLLIQHNFWIYDWLPGKHQNANLKPNKSLELFVELAASEHTKEALGILVNSPVQKHLEPLVVGLKLHMGEDVKTVTEILEIAKDVVKRIEERLKKHW